MANLLNPIPVAVKRTGLSRSTIYEKLAAGEIEFVKVGRRTLIPEDALEQFVARLRAEQADPRPAA